MKEIIIIMAEIVNNIHDVIVDTFGLHLTDKELHFWVIGIIGIITFFFVHFIFKIVTRDSDYLDNAVLVFFIVYAVIALIVYAIVKKVRSRKS